MSKRPIAKLVSALARKNPRARWALLDQAMVSGTTFLTGVLAARVLGIEEFGRFSLAFMVVLLVYAMQIAAIIQPLMSIGPKLSADERSAYFGATFVQQLLFTALSVVVLLALMWPAREIYSDSAVTALIAPTILFSVAWQLQDFVRRYLFATGRPLAAFINDCIRYGLQLAALCWFAWAQPSWLDSGAMLYMMGAVAAVALTYCAVLLKDMAFERASVRSGIARNWGSSKWLTASALITWASNNLFTFVAGAMLGASAVGALRAAQTLLNINNILFLGLENWMPSRASQLLKADGRAAMVGYLRGVTVRGGLATGAVCLTAALGAEFWLTFIYGPEFAEYAYVLQGYALAYLLIFLRHPLIAACRAIENTRIVFTSNLVGVVVAIVMAYPLLSYLGLLGAVAGKIMLMGIQAALLWYAVRAHFRATAGR